MNIQKLLISIQQKCCKLHRGKGFELTVDVMTDLMPFLSSFDFGHIFTTNHISYNNFIRDRKSDIDLMPLDLKLCFYGGFYWKRA
jgi:hypothetical protein